MASKKANNKKSNKKLIRLIISFLLLIVLLLGLFQSGVVGYLINLIFSYLFGTFAKIAILVLVICNIIFIVDIFNKSKYLNDKLTYSVVLIMFNIYFTYSIMFFISYKETLNNLLFSPEIAEKSPGNIGLIMNKIGFYLFDALGSFLISIVIWVIIGILLNSKYKFIQKFTGIQKESKKKKADEKYEKALLKKKEDTQEIEHTQTLIDTSKNVDLKKIVEDNPLNNSITQPVKPNQTMYINKETKLFDDFPFDDFKEEKNDIDVKKVNEDTTYKPEFSFSDESKENNDNKQLEDVEIKATPKITRSKKSAPKEIGRYKLPSADNLKQYENNEEVYKGLMVSAREKGELLVNTLASFKLNVSILNIVIGPSVTRYELQPEVGVKVSKFSSLSNDIALSLAASDIRIEAPIPGKAAVGIEVPNDSVMMVGLQEVFSSKENDFNKKLQVSLGKDINGSAKFLDITKAPHLLVAGSTGSGKSVCINTIITSILLKASPEEVKMVMVDPKKVELTPYDDIPHLLTNVVTDPKKACVILQQMVDEMEYRYELLAQTNTRNIESYNEKIKTNNDMAYAKLPYIVIIIDELADLMMVARNEVETSIARIAQKARAAGMHMIVATQRPSTDIITGLIKSNIPTRIAFSVASGIDSRTILDKTGAEKLLGRGDMLISDGTSPNSVRVQGAYLSDEEIQDIVEETKNQFNSEELKALKSEKLSDENLEQIEQNGELDEFYEEVKADVIQVQKASASYIQRKYRVGYNRASDILDQLEQNGVISANEGTKPRRVLISREEDY